MACNVDILLSMKPTTQPPTFPAPATASTFAIVWTDGTTTTAKKVSK